MTITYDRKTGEVHRDGLHVLLLAICKFTGFALLYRVRGHYPMLYSTDMVASLASGNTASDEALEVWALSYAANLAP